MSKKGKIAILVIFIAALIIIAGYLLLRNNKNSMEKIDVSVLNEIGIDIGDSTEQVSKVYQEGENVIIEGKNGEKTIETKTSEDIPKMKELTTEEKKQYNITDVKVSESNGKTIITGKVKNASKTTNKVVINIRFYGDDKKIKGATSEIVNVGIGETKEFEMMIQDNLIEYKYEITAEYAE